MLSKWHGFERLCSIENYSKKTILFYFVYLFAYLFYILFAFIQFDVSSLSGQNVILNGSQDLLYVSEKVNNIFLPPINTLVNVRLENVSVQNSTSHSLNSLWCWYYEVKFADDHC